jgi:hypothetical protein
MAMALQQEPPVKAAQSANPASVPVPVPCVPFWRDFVLWAILALASALLFWSLGDRCLWQDEAETALLAQSILRSGLPIAKQGENIVSQSHGKDFGPDFVWRWSPWIQFYIAAGSMGVLGPTTLAARLPFALMGVVAVALTYLLARRLFAPVAIARLSALLLTLSVPFLLQMRQARWCAVATMLLPLLLLCLHRIVSQQRLGVLGFALVSALLFYTNYFVAIGLLATILFATLLCLPHKAFLIRLGIAYLLCFLVILPGALFFDVLGKPHNLDRARIAGQLAAYFGNFASYLMPLPVLALLAVLLARWRGRPAWGLDWSRWAWLVLAITAMQFVYLGLAPWAFFRYLGVLLPLAAILNALVLYWLGTFSIRLTVVLLLVLVATDGLHRVPLAYLKAPGTRRVDEFPSLTIERSSRHGAPGERRTITLVSYPLIGYVYELTHPIDDPEWLVAQYLRQHAQPNDTVLVSYGDLPLQYYTGLHVVGGLQGQELPKDADWIFLRQFFLSSQPGEDRDTIQFVLDHVDLHRYEMINLGGRELCLSNDPDPTFHVFRMPKEGKPVLLFRKMKP